MDDVQAELENASAKYHISRLEALKVRTQVVSELHQQLTRTCVLGKAPDDAIKAISKKFEVSKSQAGRLVMTEQAYFHSAAQKEAFKELDVEEFEIVATLDSHTSKVCQEMDGKHFPMKEYQEGLTAPPFHPWCRTVTVPFFDDEFSLGERAARGEDGKTYYVPSDMTYKDWKKSMVDGQTDGLEYMSLSNGVQLGYTKPIKHTPEELQELVSYANKKGINVFQIQKFDGDGEILKEQIDVLSELKNEYNYSRKLTISFADLGRKDLAVTSKKGKTITFNNLALRSREMTNAYLNADNYLSSTDIKGIAAHEMGHVLEKAYGIKGLDIVQKAYYNLTGNSLQHSETIKYLRSNISRYSSEKDEQYAGKPTKPKHFKEITSEMFGKHFTNPDEFTTEFINLLKEVWRI